jgi:hypothetical protein
VEYQGRFHKDEQRKRDEGLNLGSNGSALCHNNSKNHGGKDKQANKVRAQ